MIPRLLQLPLDQSFFLFGARNTGKSTLIEHFFKDKESILFTLLDPETDDKFRSDPTELEKIVRSLPKQTKYVVLDECQKNPRLLDIIHKLIESTDKKYIMTGSSARKLKHGGANLLAGRAFVYNLHPFSFLELKNNFDLDSALNYGLLPKIQQLYTKDEKTRFLQAYAHTYLREEIWAEHFIRELEPFRKFLEVAAQMNGKIINFAGIAQDVGIDDKTVKKYYAILEDTLIGFFLEGFTHSFRKRLSTKPKFYFFDTGIVRALSRILSVPLIPRTSAYGDAFEHFIILEFIKLSSYANNEYKFSYLRTKNDAEVDLIVDRPGKDSLFIEIKSSDNVTSDSISSFIKLTKDFGNCEAICISKDIYAKTIDHVKVVPWQEALTQYAAPNLTITE